ncbi:MAG: glutamine-hydrolyzing GMP synthase [Chlorobi bacterium]|nr:MAG: glutamine-hydrolyzing GMP synthase [Bacteroidota bacterium]MBL1160862.1 glutamine-hydrolyzing GMP synthase [Chlorobiota bacterium]MBW7852822.1 glutamine-hydrolyzing GMP synthase [Candidatus Kapabacteria bacterium]MCC6330947.1 glutamine-hydrolyzing GMP synthase [Ignavibacteria bacterium]MBZ0195535.1 glutamine-hydrolyzing GMP synthase [Candidatus Kapabacteria bacterium]
MTHGKRIVVLDFGSQYTQLIARRIREIGVYTEIHPYSISQENLQALQPSGIILSGGPQSVYETGAPHPNADVFNLGVPVLGICYGLQLIAWANGGTVEKAERREFGRAELLIDSPTGLFEGLSTSTEVWMSHGDHLTKIPPGFDRVARTRNAEIGAIVNHDKQIWGVQFHPEVHHTVEGLTLLKNFVVSVCGCAPDWNAASFIEASVADIKATVGNGGVICALSGGVDSTVAAVLLSKALGNQVHCIHVDSGLMRAGESAQIISLFREHFNISVDLVDGSELFLSRLAGVTDPEQKRKIIGTTFIELFEAEASKFGDAQFLAQGTLYPDVIESISIKGPSQTIKTHHNVGGLPERMNLKLIEPFRELFKDEVRAVGRMLGVPDWFVNRHPFPGPGLAIRIPGEVTHEKAEILRQADTIFLDEIRKAGLYDNIWQAFCVLLPVRTVGVMGDERTYEHVCALRAVTGVDGMTADWYHFPYQVLAQISNRIINEVRGINRVVYDISSKPPATIEWE